MRNAKSNNTVLKSRSVSGQITVFIILGIIILFSVALVIYVQQAYNKVRPPVAELVVDDQVKPIQTYVTSCLESISKEALIQLGQNGGYLNLNNMRVGPEPYDSDVLVFGPQKMPYWYYLTPCQGSTIGCLQERTPELCDSGRTCIIQEYTGSPSIEGTLDAYINENINKCIDFSVFNNTFNIVTGNISTDAQIMATGVGFKLNYPLTITLKSSGKSYIIPYFYTIQDVRLADIYVLSRQIRDAEANYTFLERNTLNFISLYSGVDENLLPPMSGLQLFVNAQQYWLRSAVKKDLMTSILPYTMMLQIVNAGNARQFTPLTTRPDIVPFEQGIYNSMMIRVSNDSYPSLGANIYYPGSDIYFNIGNSELIKPNSFKGGNDIISKILGFSLYDYSFRYDLSYPVIVRVSDPNAFGGEGYTFSYAMEANIRQNVPVDSNVTSLNVPQDQFSIPEAISNTNSTVTIITYDAYTQKPLPDVTITYYCGQQTDIGTTVLDNSGKAILKSNFPYCAFGGEIYYEKEGYMGSAIDFNNPGDNGTVSFKLQLWPLQQKNVVVYKRTASDIARLKNSGTNGLLLYGSAYTLLGPNDTVFLNMNKVKDDLRETDVPMVSFLMYKGKGAPVVQQMSIQNQEDYVNNLYSTGTINDSTRQEMLSMITSQSGMLTVINATTPDNYTMDFVPGVYTISAAMMYNGEINIPQSTTEICPINIIGIQFGCKSITMQPQKFESWPDGGVNVNMTLTPQDVYSNSTIVIFVAQSPLPISWDDVESSPSIDAYESDKMAFLRPIVY